MGDLFEESIDSKYKKIVLINPLNIKNEFHNQIYIKRKAEFDKNFDIFEYLIKQGIEKNFDKKLKELCLSNKYNIDLVLLLRCKVSHAIKDVINDIHGKIIKKYNLNLDKKDLMSDFLEDRGDRKVLLKNTNPKIKKKFIKESFNYQLIEKEANRINKLRDLYKTKSQITNFKKKIYLRIYPFVSDIIYSFDHQRNAEIARWTELRIYGDRKFKEKIGIQGRLILKSIWSILGNTSLSTIEKALEFSPEFKNNKISDESKLIKFYLDNYKTEKLKYLEIKGIQYGWEPSFNNFLNQKDIDHLKKVGNALTAYLGRNRFIDINKSNTSISSGNNEKNNNDFFESQEADVKHVPNELEIFIAKFIKKQNKFYMSQQLKQDMQTWNTYPDRKKAWILMSKIDLKKIYYKEQIKDELNNIAKKCKTITGQSRQVSWLTKRFLYEKNLLKVFHSLIETLKELIYSDEFIIKFNEDNIDNQINNSTLKLLKKEFIYEYKNNKGKLEKEFILDNPTRLKQFALNFQNYLNPKRERKTELIILLKELLRENKII